MPKAIKKYLHLPTWLTLTILAILILRIPTFYEPYSYGDEMIYLTLGEAIRQKVPLYSHIHDNKPPLLYITAGIAGNLFWFKAILAVCHSITLILFWKLSQTLFPKKQKTQQISTFIFAILTTIPFLEGNIVNSELFMMGPTIAGLLILLNKKLTPKNLIISGILFSISTLFKIPAVFDIPAIVFLWLVSMKKANFKNIKTITTNTLYLAIGFATPILITFVWFSISGSFKEYLIAAFLQNIGYLSSWRPSDTSKPFLVKNAPLILRGLVVAVTLTILYLKKNKLSKQFIFLTTWLVLSLFAVTLSERPYPHYLLQSVPAISMLVGILVTLENIEQSLAIIPLSLAFIVPVYFNFWYYPTTPYYTRFIKLITNRISENQYLRSFDTNTPRNYKIANYITSSTKRNEKIFIWGNGVSIYALSRRLPPTKYVADYHINDFSSKEETLSKIKKDMPTMIIILPDSENFPELSSFLKNNYGLVQNIDEAAIWKVLNPKVRTLLKSQPHN